MKIWQVLKALEEGIEIEACPIGGPVEEWSLVTDRQYWSRESEGKWKFRVKSKPVEPFEGWGCIRPGQEFVVVHKTPEEASRCKMNGDIRVAHLREVF